ncbi:MAG: hypothetical protein JO089_07760 [Alphaproteobacteria bacterium]|nr:hypothetical protein [Alphaproteobacteria bacterium]
MDATIQVDDGQLTYQQFLTKYMPERLSRAMEPNQKLKEGEAYIADKTRYAVNQQSIDDLTERLQGFHAVLKDLAKVRSLARDAHGALDVDHVKGQTATIRALQRWFIDAADDKEKRAAEINDEALKERLQVEAAGLNGVANQLNGMIARYAKLVDTLEVAPQTWLEQEGGALRRVTDSRLSPNAQEAGAAAMRVARNRTRPGSDDPDREF